MTDASEFRKRAKECMDMAPKLGPESRPLLMSIAEAWLVLAHAAEIESPVQQTHKVENKNHKLH